MKVLKIINSYYCSKSSSFRFRYHLFTLVFLCMMFACGNNILLAQTIINTINLAPEFDNGSGPVAIGVNPATNLIYVVNGCSKNVIVIQGSSNEVLGTINVEGDDIDDIAVNSATNLIYVTSSEGIIVISGSTNEVVTSIGFEKHPRGVAVNPSTNRIYVLHSNVVSIIDGSTNQVIASIDVEDDVGDVEVNPTTNRIYIASSNNNTVSVIDGSINEIIAAIGVGSFQSHLRAVGINTATDRIYVTNSFMGSHNVSVIDGSTNDVIGTINVDAREIAVNSTTNLIYVTSSEGINVISGSTNEVVTSIEVGNHPDVITVDPITNRIYVSKGFFTDINVSVIDGLTNQVVDTVSVRLESFLQGIGVNPVTNLIS